MERQTIARQGVGGFGRSKLLLEEPCQTIDMLEDKSDYSERRQGMTAYISESQDRENNTFYEAVICDEEKSELIKEISDYDRDALVKEVMRQYPEIEIESA